MAGPLAVPVIGAIGNLLGGLFGRSKQKVISAGDNFQSHIGGLMLAAKEHGFNPLTLLQNGQAIGPTVLNSDNSAFGAGIANAFALAGDAIASKRATAQKLNNYQTQNQRLQSRLDAITLRSPVPGVYGVAKMPSDPEVYGNAADLPKTGFNLPFHAPLSAAADIPRPDSVTPVQAAVAQDVPAFRLFGRDFFGSGMFSSGQQIEDALGEGPMQWAYQPVAVVDAIGNEVYKDARDKWLPFGREVMRRANVRSTTAPQNPLRDSVKRYERKLKGRNDTFGTLGFQ